MVCYRVVSWICLFVCLFVCVCVCVSNPRYSFLSAKSYIYMKCVMKVKQSEVLTVNSLLGSSATQSYEMERHWHRLVCFPICSIAITHHEREISLYFRVTAVTSGDCISACEMFTDVSSRTYKCWQIHFYVKIKDLTHPSFSWAA
jgi:hypothetical protein